MKSLNTEIIISEFIIKNTNHHHHHQPNGTKSLPCYGIHIHCLYIFQLDYPDIASSNQFCIYIPGKIRNSERNSKELTLNNKA
ncbi:hypothetical protein DERF_010313 [Dermatophagoides farinae]|uniref:Uncharacterized protein n=1 Tax=Dermatophagoides farinae TaxID=6954 RepID=A0A922HWS2_DERFA|nr:hypothetical protein DERF_010313 [Dermatophagoides farinae]